MTIDQVQEDLLNKEDEKAKEQIVFSEEEIKKATEYLDSIKESMSTLKVEVGSISDVIKCTISSQDLIEYRKSWISKYLDNIIKAKIILPMAIWTNQAILQSMNEDIAKEEYWTQNYWAIRANILATVTQIKTIYDDIESRIEVIKQYEEIIRQLDLLLNKDNE